MKASKTRSLEGQEVSRTHGLPLLALVSVAVLSGLYNGIWDCDESMNYWEPTHYLLFGTGLQTWEYRYDNAPLPLSLCN
jgi:alpha-1,2-mannosyltransferase